MKKTVVSGTQTTGNLHLGNYLGAIINWVKLQDEYKCYFFLADLHSITIDRSPLELKSSIFEAAAGYIAAGLDPTKSIIFAQSAIKEHTELAWIFNCITPLGWLKRMTQFKDKAGKNQENANFGLLAYPVLQAADILLYHPDFVPVGEDQKQHIELTRDIAASINRKFNQEIFKLPQPLIQGKATRIMSLKDGTRKMSKSDASDYSRINFTDNPDLIMDKIKKAKTDSITEINYDQVRRPEISNLIDIYSTLASISAETIVNQYNMSGFAKFKSDLAELLIAKLTPITHKYNELMKNQDYLVTILNNGADEARQQAAKTVSNIKELFGFIV